MHSTSVQVVLNPIFFVFSESLCKLPGSFQDPQFGTLHCSGKIVIPSHTSLHCSGKIVIPSHTSLHCSGKIVIP